MAGTPVRIDNVINLSIVREPFHRGVILTQTKVLLLTLIMGLLLLRTSA